MAKSALFLLVTVILFWPMAKWRIVSVRPIIVDLNFEGITFDGRSYNNLMSEKYIRPYYIYNDFFHLHE